MISFEFRPRQIIGLGHILNEMKSKKQSSNRINYLNIVTTHALQSLLGLLASSLKWLVRPLGKGSKVREHGNVVSIPLIIVPYHLVPRPMFVPKRRSQQGVVDSRSVTTLSLLLETLPFIVPNSLSLDNYISRDQYVTSGMGFLVPSYMFFQH